MSSEAEKENEMPLRLVWMSPAELADNPANWRLHPDKQASSLKGALEEVGWAGACLWNSRTKRLIDGHLRKKVAIERGEQKIPVLIGSWDENEERKILATLDPLAALAETDAAKLDELLKSIDTDNESLKTLLEDLEAEAAKHKKTDIVEDKIPEPMQEPITQPGDLWILGDHRLLCGDATNADAVSRLMNGEKAKLLNTDPPYGVDYSKTKNGIPRPGFQDHQEKWGDIANDDMEGSRLQEFLEACFRAVLPHLADAAWYLWHAHLTQGFFAAAAAAAAAKVVLHRQIIWRKPGFVLTRSGMYHWAHEPCFYGWVKGHRPAWYGDKSQRSVWELGRDKDHGEYHPTQKPVELFAIPIRNHLREGEICLDPFAGSGSQLIAAQQLSRKCYCSDISPAYCDVIVRRWEAFTGRKAVKESRQLDT